MDSTIIAVLLAGAVIFWHAPFSLTPMLRITRRGWRWVLLALLLTALGTAKTHNATAIISTINSDSIKTMATCQQS